MSETRKEMALIRKRANQLFDAWLRGIIQGGHEATMEDLKEVWRASVDRARLSVRPK